MMDGLKSLVSSRKFWLMALGIALLLLNEPLGLGLDTVPLVAAIGVIVAEIMGIALEDAAEKRSK